MLYSFGADEVEMMKDAIRELSKTETKQAILDKLASGGHYLFLGVVIDQDGDANWEIATHSEFIEQWGHNVATVSFETPRIYQLALRADGGVDSTRLSFVPDPDKSNWE